MQEAPVIRHLSPASLRNLAEKRGVEAEAQPRERVIPLAVFAAGRQRFEMVVRGFSNSLEAKELAFSHLPLEENGWTRDHAKVSHVRNVDRAMIFLVERV